MITGGIDIGVYATKLVIMDDRSILATRIMRTGNRIKTSVTSLIRKTLKELSIDNVDRFVATGVGRKRAPYCDTVIPEIVADAHGVTWMLPSARTVIDVGAEEVRVIKCDEKGDVLNYIRNNRCAAGAGVFLESMARVLEVPLEELGPLALKSQNEVHISPTCVVFSESEVVSMIHAKVAREDLARAISESIATKISTLVNSVVPEKDVVLIGGVAKNTSVIEELNKLLGLDIQVPAKPQVTGAIGAALLARQPKGNIINNGK